MSASSIWHEVRFYPHTYHANLTRTPLIHQYTWYGSSKSSTVAVLGKQTQCRLKVYPGLELRAQPGLSSLPGSPLCLQLVLVLPDVIVLQQHHHSYVGKQTRNFVLLDVIVLQQRHHSYLESTQESHAPTSNHVLCQTSAAAVTSQDSNSCSCVNRFHHMHAVQCCR